MDPLDAVANAIIEALSGKVDEKVLRRALTFSTKKDLYRRLAENLLYCLIQDGKVPLPPGYGTILLKRIQEKDKKIFNRKTGEMTVRHIKGNTVKYRLGELVKQLVG